VLHLVDLGEDVDTLFLYNRVEAENLVYVGTFIDANSPHIQARFADRLAGLWGKLDKLKIDLDANGLLLTLAVGTVTFLSTSLTVGYIVWTIRGGYLLASLLSSLPAWKMVDTLAILDGVACGYRDEDDEEDESLTTMVKHGSIAKAKTGKHS